MAEPGSPTGVATADAVTVAVSDQQCDVEIDADRWAELAAAVAVAEGGVGELTLTFVDRDEMAELNREHMGGSGPTDVLSFPLDAVGELDHGAGPIGPTLLGDVVVCPAVADDQAPVHAGNLDDELALLVVHGCLHVFGHDHAEPSEGDLMRARELELLMSHHWRGPAPAGFRQEHE